VPSCSRAPTSICNAEGRLTSRSVEQNGVRTYFQGAIANPLEVFARQRVRRYSLYCTDVFAMLYVGSVASDFNTVTN
jgi:hypothetical protein